MQNTCPHPLNTIHPHKSNPHHFQQVFHSCTACLQKSCTTRCDLCI